MTGLMSVLALLVLVVLWLVAAAVIATLAGFDVKLAVAAVVAMAILMWLIQLV